MSLLLSIENLSKSTPHKVLFEQISFGLEKGNRIALVAANGSGKTSLLRILAGHDKQDAGLVVATAGVRIGYLPQEPEFDPNHTVWQAMFRQGNPVLTAVREYEKALENPDIDLHPYLDKMEEYQAWDYEQNMKAMLDRFRITDLEQKVGTLSGGQRKRLALTALLLEPYDLYILDEPTNHLDLDMVEWLEELLAESHQTILMVTHDRHFLEAVCNGIIELDKGKLYSYEGNYSNYLEQREMRMMNEASNVQKAQNLMRKELEWIRRQPKARGTKAKYRVDAFEDLKKRAEARKEERSLLLDVRMSRLGGKIIEVEKVFKSFGERKLISDFSYMFKRGDRIGIVGRNGVGKSTFLNVITGKLAADQGKVDVGQTVKFGYYRQDGIQVPDQKRVIDVVKDYGEYLETTTGQVSASQFLERFLFPPEQQYQPVNLLSGGERRRLYLLTILISNPNFLILDEPTNDLDIITIQVLEEFLETYPGCLLVVSHDRHFLNKTVDQLFLFEGEGYIKSFGGHYQDYLDHKALQWIEEQKKPNTPSNVKQSQPQPQAAKQDKKLTYQEQLEYDAIEKEIEKLEVLKKQLELKMSDVSLSADKMVELAEEFGKVDSDLSVKTNRWLELAEKM